MNISLTPPLENYIHSKVNSGLYASASEVVRAGLRALNEQEQERQLDNELLEALATSGKNSQPFDDKCIEEIANNIVNQ